MLCSPPPATTLASSCAGSEGFCAPCCRRSSQRSRIHNRPKTGRTLLLHERLFAGARGGAERENADDTPAAAVRAGGCNGEDLMKSIVIAAGVLLAATALSPAPAAAAGCLKGAVVGGVAG